LEIEIYAVFIRNIFKMTLPGNEVSSTSRVLMGRIARFRLDHPKYYSAAKFLYTVAAATAIGIGLPIGGVVALGTCADTCGSRPASARSFIKDLDHTLRWYFMDDGPDNMCREEDPKPVDERREYFNRYVYGDAEGFKQACIPKMKPINQDRLELANYDCFPVDQIIEELVTESATKEEVGLFAWWIGHTIEGRSDRFKQLKKFLDDDRIPLEFKRGLANYLWNFKLAGYIYLHDKYGNDFGNYQINFPSSDLIRNLDRVRETAESRNTYPKDAFFFFLYQAVEESNIKSNLMKQKMKMLCQILYTVSSYDKCKPSMETVYAAITVLKAAYAGISLKGRVISFDFEKCMKVQVVESLENSSELYQAKLEISVTLAEFLSGESLMIRFFETPDKSGKPLAAPRSPHVTNLNGIFRELGIKCEAFAPDLNHPDVRTLSCPFSIDPGTYL